MQNEYQVIIGMRRIKLRHQGIVTGYQAIIAQGKLQQPVMPIGNPSRCLTGLEHKIYACALLPNPGQPEDGFSGCSTMTDC